MRRHGQNGYHASRPGVKRAVGFAILTRARDNATAILGELSEPQPDGALIIEPTYGGQTGFSEDGYASGPPELIVEIASSSASIDLHTKRRDYEQAGVLEYVVIVIRQQVLRWFILQEEQYQEIVVDTEGIFKSAVFPGLWLDAEALLQLDVSKVLETLQKGLTTQAHDTFVQQLQAHRPRS